MRPVKVASGCDKLIPFSALGNSPYVFSMKNVECAAAKVGEKVADTWRASSPTGSSLGVPLGVVAGLALFNQWTDHDCKDLIEQSDESQIAQLLADVWGMFTILRPELAFRCGHFGDWLNEEPQDRPTRTAVADVARSATKSGIFSITGDEEQLRAVDLLGHVHQALSGQRDKQARGEYYTPGAVAEMIAGMTITDLEPGQWTCDPCAGTGGLLRAGAINLRGAGLDPAEYGWAGCDISRTAVAALAVNVHLWGLGPNVLIGRANILTEGDWHVRAQQEQDQAIKIQQGRLRVARMQAVLRDR